MIEDKTKYKSAEEATAAEAFNEEVNETEITHKPLMVEVPGYKNYESEELVSPDEYEKILPKLQAEIAKAVEDGMFDRGNIPGFHYEIDGKHFNFRRSGGIRIVDQTPGGTQTFDSLEEHEQTTGVHEKAHGDFGLRFSKLVETGEDRQFVQDVIRQLEQNNIWERAATTVTTGWPLSALGINNPKLQSFVDERSRNGSFDIQGFFSLAQKELSEDDYALLQKGILNEINSIAAESKSKTVTKIFREVFASTSAGQSDLPAEV